MKNIPVFGLLLMLLAASVAAGIGLGGTYLPLEDILRALSHPRERDISGVLIWEVRLPRVLMAMVIGSGLAGCGVVLQAILRNPLAEPYTLGVSGGGALGAVIALILGLSGLRMVALCFGGCCLSMLLVLGLAALKGFSNTMLILSGVILSFLFSSVMMLVLALSSARDVHASVMWLMGNLGASQGLDIKLMVFGVLPLLAVPAAMARDLNVLSLGDEQAQHLGMDVNWTKVVLLIATALVTGMCVAVSGIISFIGLVIPHTMRRLVGPDHHVLVPASLIGGATLLVLSDTLAQVLIRPLELPVGVVTGILGGVFFLGLLLKQGEVA